MQVPSFYYFDYTQRPPTDGHAPKQLIVLLHGFSQTGKKMLASLADVLPDDALVISPNGPFPLPYKHDGIFKVAFSWYFYDLHKQEYFIDMQIPRQVMRDAINELNLNHLPTQIIGFSQGGFLAPFLALSLTNVRQVIGIGCDYIVDELKLELQQSNATALPYPLHGIHGKRDRIIPLEGPRINFPKLETLGNKGQLFELENTEHLIDQDVQSLVRKISHFEVT